MLLSRPIEFMSTRGRIYDAKTIRPIVLARLRKRWPGMLREGWIARVDAKLTDEAWLRAHNGEIPERLVDALDLIVLDSDGVIE